MPVADKVNSIVELLNRAFKKDPAVNLVLINDDYLYEGIVREALMSVFGYSVQKARELMMAAHQFGSSIIWSGERGKAEEYAVILRIRYGITTEIVDD
jgi:ATP-dependent Clp protease adapter protein ClpS